MHFNETDGHNIVTNQAPSPDGSSCDQNAASLTPAPQESGQPVQDISGRKSAREELEESAAQMQTLIDAMPDIVCFKDGEGRWLLANEFDLRLFQLTGVNYKGKTDADLAEYSQFYRDAFLNCKETDEQAWQAGKASRMDEIIPTPDGQSRIFDVFKIPTFHADGSRKGLVVIGRDITDHKNADRATAEAIAELERFFRIVPDLVCVASTDGYFQKLNPAWEEVLGFSVEELLSQPFVEFIHPDDIDSTGREVQRQTEGGQTIDFVNRYRCKDGSYRHLEWRATPAGENTLYAVARDITERLRADEALRASEEKFRSIYENAPVGIFQSTPEGELLSTNPAAVRMFGYDSAQEMLQAGQNIGQSFFVHPERRNEIVRRTLASEDYCQTENEYRRKDGSTFIANLHMRAVRKNGDVAFIEGFVEDITERKQAEADKRALEQGLEEHKRKFYRETILSVTSGKLDICDTEEVEPYIASAQLCIDISKPQDVGNARREIEAIFRHADIDEERLSTFAIAAGEAITNSLKHASQGRAYAGKIGDEIWVGVVDEGPGIESLVLPGAVLRRGFSTKPSMGLGYSIMLDAADRILLKTDPTGTTVILINRLHEITPSIDSLPDTW